MPYILALVIVLALVLLNGVFSMAEFAIVSAKKFRLRKRADDGDRRAAAALELMQEPTPFLSTIQIGITLVGTLAGAYGGITLANELAVRLAVVTALAPYSDVLGIGIVVLAITYVTLVFGELVPKRVALSNPENLASAVAKPMQILSRIAAPLVFILSFSTDTVLRLLQVRTNDEPPVTEEDIRMVLEAGGKAGIIEESELNMVEGVFDLDKRQVGSLMTHRSDLVALDLHNPDAENIRTMIRSGRSNFPVYEGGELDNIVGMVTVKDVLARVADGKAPCIRASATKALFVPETRTVLKLLELFREKGMHRALVTDEYGSIRGMITLHDIFTAIAGEVRTHGDREDPVVVREDGSYLISGDTPVRDIKGVLSVDSFPGEGEGRYRTIAGLVLFVLERVPKTGDHIIIDGLRYEIVDMDGNRIDKVLVTRAVPGPPVLENGSGGGAGTGSGSGGNSG